jgi:magnesium-transporting ATPase (P-type)
MIPEAHAAVNFADPRVNPAAQFWSIGEIFNLVIPIAMVLASLVFLAILIYGAYVYTTSSGEQEAIIKARKTITYAVMGLILIFISYLLVTIIGMITGINLPA